MGEVFQSEGRRIVGCVGEDNVKSGPLESHLAADESGAIEAHSVQVEMKEGGRNRKWERRGRMEKREGINTEWEEMGE